MTLSRPGMRLLPNLVPSLVPSLVPGLAGLLLLAAASSAAAQSCATIGSSTFCGARGSHNTVGNTVIFNNGPAGQRIGNFTVTGTPPRSQVLRGAESRGLAGPRTFSGVRPSIPLNSGRGSRRAGKIGRAHV